MALMFVLDRNATLLFLCVARHAFTDLLGLQPSKNWHGVRVIDYFKEMGKKAERDAQTCTHRRTDKADRQAEAPLHRSFDLRVTLWCSSQINVSDHPVSLSLCDWGRYVSRKHKEALGPFIYQPLDQSETKRNQLWNQWNHPLRRWHHRRPQCH